MYGHAYIDYRLNPKQTICVGIISFDGTKSITSIWNGRKPKLNKMVHPDLIRSSIRIANLKALSKTDRATIKILSSISQWLKDGKLPVKTPNAPHTYHWIFDDLGKTILKTALLHEAGYNEDYIVTNAQLKSKHRSLYQSNIGLKIGA